MKDYLRYLLIILLSMLVASGCSLNDSKLSTEKDLESIIELQETYQRGVNTDDLDLFMSAWAEDAVRLESGIHYIVGKEKIREHFKPMFDLFNFKITLYGDIERRVEGDIAFSHANFLISQSPKGSDTVMHIDFKYLEIYERQDDGTWKIIVGSAFTNPQWTDDSLPDDLLKNEDTSGPKL